MQVIRNVLATHKYTIRLVLSRPAHMYKFSYIVFFFFSFRRFVSHSLEMEDERTEYQAIYENYFIQKNTANEFLSTDCAI